MCLSPPGWTTVTVLCTASHNVKFHIYRDYKILQLGLLQTLVNSVIQLQHCDNITGLLLTFMSIPGLSPPYISELINVKPKSSYSLRSHNDTALQYPQQKILATLGARSFASAASSLCDKLPAAIRNATSLNEFKNMIETFLFNKILKFTLLFFHIVINSLDLIHYTSKAILINVGKALFKLLNYYHLNYHQWSVSSVTKPWC